MRRVLWMVWVLATGCGWGDGAAEQLAGPPRGADEVQAWSVEDSSLQIPLTISADVVQAEVSSKIPRVLLDVKSQQTDHGVSVDLRVERTGEPTVSTAGGDLTIDVPLSLKVKPKAPGALRLPKNLASITASMMVTVDLRPKITKDWQLLPRPTLSHRWTKPPRLKVGPFQVDIQGLADAQVSVKLSEIEEKLAMDLRGKIDIRGPISKAWAELGAPRKVRDSPATWLFFHPRTLYASNPKMDRRGIHVVVGASGPLQVTVGAVPDKAPPRPLPERSRPPRNPEVAIATPIALSWTTLSEQLKAASKGQKVSVDLPTGGKATVTLRRLLDVYPSGSKLALGFALDVRALGQTVGVQAWMSGTPEVDGDQLRIADFDYVATSNSSWVNGAHALVSDRVRDELGKRLVIPMQDRMDDIEKMIDTHLSKAPTVSGVSISGDVQQVALAGVQVTQEALLVRAEVAGAVAVEVTEVPR